MVNSEFRGTGKMLRCVGRKHRSEPVLRLGNPETVSGNDGSYLLLSPSYMPQCAMCMIISYNLHDIPQK